MTFPCLKIFLIYWKRCMIKKKKLEMGENIVKSRLFRLMAVAAAIVLLLGACSNNDDEEAQKPMPEPDEQTEEIPELEAEEAEEVLQTYNEAFQNVIENAAEDGEVTAFDSPEELQEEFSTIMSEDLAAKMADAYFEENEEGSIYIVASEEPVWFDEEETYELEKAEDNLYEVEQEQTDNMLSVTYSIFWNEEKWIVSDVETEDIPVEENDGDTSNSEAEADSNQTEQENNTDNDTADQDTDGAAAEETNESTDEDTANNEANATEEENDQVSPDSEENNSGQGGTDTSDSDTSDDTDMDNSESNQNPESEENEEENTDENASSIDAAAAEKLVKEHLNMVDDSLEVVTSHQDEEGNYVVQVYELVDQDDGLAHTATYGWYTVDQTTGKVKETEF